MKKIISLLLIVVFIGTVIYTCYGILQLGRQGGRAMPELL